MYGFVGIELLLRESFNYCGFSDCAGPQKNDLVLHVAEFSGLVKHLGFCII